MRPSFFHHLHPPTIPAEQARWRYTLGAGGLAVFLVLILIATGLLEMYYYIPTPEGAAGSVQTITFLVPYGALVRNLHFWAAQALVIVAAVHLLRVVFTGAYVRRFNFLLGLALLVLSLFLDFTGYVLRWDEGIRWALTAGTNLIKSIPGIGPALYVFAMGGTRPGAPTLIRFYSWHIFGLTLLLVGIGAWHLFRVRRDGGISVPPPDLRPNPQRISRFELVRREVLAMLVSLAVLFVVASFFPAPLGPAMTSSTAATADSRAPWFFLWVQQMLKWGQPFWMGVLIPLGLLVVLGLIPYVLPDIPPEQRGRWFPPAGRLAQILAALITLGILILTILAIWPAAATP